MGRYEDTFNSMTSAIQGAQRIALLREQFEEEKKNNELQRKVQELLLQTETLKLDAAKARQALENAALGSIAEGLSTREPQEGELRLGISEEGLPIPQAVTEDELGVLGETAVVPGTNLPPRDVMREIAARQQLFANPEVTPLGQFAAQRLPLGQLDEAAQRELGLLASPESKLSFEAAMAEQRIRRELGVSQLTFNLFQTLTDRAGSVVGQEAAAAAFASGDLGQMLQAFQTLGESSGDVQLRIASMQALQSVANDKSQLAAAYLEALNEDRSLDIEERKALIAEAESLNKELSAIADTPELLELAPELRRNVVNATANLLQDMENYRSRLQQRAPEVLRNGTSFYTDRSSQSKSFATTRAESEAKRGIEALEGATADATSRGVIDLDVEIPGTEDLGQTPIPIPPAPQQQGLQGVPDFGLPTSEDFAIPSGGRFVEQGASPSPSVPLPVPPPRDPFEPLVSKTETDFGQSVRTRFNREINDASISSGLHPSLIAAVITTESSGNPKEESKKGALGLMQVKPIASADVGGPTDHEALLRADVNTRVGSAYLRSLLDEFDSVQLALAAYNWGETKLRRHLRDGKSFDQLPESVKAYVSKVMSLAQSLGGDLAFQVQ